MFDSFLDSPNSLYIQLGKFRGKKKSHWKNHMIHVEHITDTFASNTEHTRLRVRRLHYPGSGPGSGAATSSGKRLLALQCSGSSPVKWKQLCFLHCGFDHLYKICRLSY